MYSKDGRVSHTRAESKVLPTSRHRGIWVSSYPGYQDIGISGYQDNRISRFQGWQACRIDRACRMIKSGGTGSGVARLAVLSKLAG